VVERGQLLAETDSQRQRAKLSAAGEALMQLLPESTPRPGLEARMFARKDGTKPGGKSREDSTEQKRLDEHVRKVAKWGAFQNKIHQAQLRIMSSQAELELARIIAPMDGTVLSFDAKIGQRLIAGKNGAVVMRLGDLSSMTVTAQVAEADSARFSLRTDVHVTTLGDVKHERHAKLRGLPEKVLTPPASGSSVAMHTALVDVDNRDGALRPETAVQLRFVFASAEKSIVVPLSALVGGEPRVWVLGACGEVEKRSVRLGVRNRVDVQVVAGLREGERVIVREKLAAARRPRAAIAADASAIFDGPRGLVRLLRAWACLLEYTLGTPRPDTQQHETSNPLPERCSEWRGQCPLQHRSSTSCRRPPLQAIRVGRT